MKVRQIKDSMQKTMVLRNQVIEAYSRLQSNQPPQTQRDSVKPNSILSSRKKGSPPSIDKSEGLAPSNSSVLNSLLTNRSSTRPDTGAKPFHLPRDSSTKKVTGAKLSKKKPLPHPPKPPGAPKPANPITSVKKGTNSSITR